MCNNTVNSDKKQVNKIKNIEVIVWSLFGHP